MPREVPVEPDPAVPFNSIVPFEFVLIVLPLTEIPCEDVPVPPVVAPIEILPPPVDVIDAVALNPIEEVPVPPIIPVFAVNAPEVEIAAPTRTPWEGDPDPPDEFLKVTVPEVPVVQLELIFMPAELEPDPL
jgi:hypothetical protein